MSIETKPAKCVQSELEIAIEAPVGRVWRALVEEIDAWWLPDFRVVGEGSVLSLDARAGGGLVERLEGGGSLLWYTVQMCVPETSLHLVGHLAPEWGGPAISMLELALEGSGGHTRLRVRDALFGNVNESTGGSQCEGWQALFGRGLREHVEAR